MNPRDQVNQLVRDLRAIRAAQKRLEATTHEIKHLEAQVDSLRLAEALKVL